MVTATLLPTAWRKIYELASEGKTQEALTLHRSLIPLMNMAFNVARAKYRAEHTAWTNLSFVLSGRFNLPVAMMNMQRQGDLDLLVRCMEDEFEANKMAAFTAGSFAFLDPDMHHFAMACGETIVQVHGQSPFQFNYVNPNDDPSRNR